MELTVEAEQAIFELVVFRLQKQKCFCHLLKRIKCSRCRIMERVKKAFPKQYFAACEFVALEEQGHPSRGN